MKAKTLSIVLLLTTSSAMASTSQNSIKFVAADLTPASNVCVIAAEKGVKAAKVAARKLLPKSKHVELSTICNGLPLNKFAKQFQFAKAN